MSIKLRLAIMIVHPKCTPNEPGYGVGVLRETVSKPRPSTECRGHAPTVSQGMDRTRSTHGPGRSDAYPINTLNPYRRDALGSEHR